MIKSLTANCNECGHLFVINRLEQQPIEAGDIAVGMRCPSCHTWYHCYFTNTDLEQKRRALELAAKVANRSEAHFERYKRVKALFSQAFDRLNPRPEESMDLGQALGGSGGVFSGKTKGVV